MAFELFKFTYGSNTLLVTLGIYESFVGL